MQVMQNPRLDKIFTDAYKSTMKKIEVREADKHASDYLSTLSSMFEQDLYNRDLSQDERREFMQAFHNELENRHHHSIEAAQKRRKGLIIAGSSTVGALALSFGIFTATARPFMPLPKIESQLEYYLEKVEEGFGSYSKKFYALADKQSRKLPDPAESQYRDDMYDAIERHFNEAVTKLESGEMRYRDDAKQWASRFPDAEERKDRKEQADNAFKQGLGTAVGDSLEDVKEGAKELIQKAVEFIKDAVNREE